MRRPNLRRRGGVVPTTGYLKDFTEKLRTYNENDTPFTHLHNQSKILRELYFRNDHQYVVFGTTGNPQYAAVKDFGIVDEIWVDQNGQYDDFDQYLRENPGTWRPTCLEDGSISFEADSDSLTPAENESGKRLEFELINETSCWFTIAQKSWIIERNSGGDWTQVVEGVTAGEDTDVTRTLDPGSRHYWFFSLQEYPLGVDDQETHIFESLSPGDYRLVVRGTLNDEEITRSHNFTIGE